MAAASAPGAPPPMAASVSAMSPAQSESRPDGSSGAAKASSPAEAPGTTAAVTQKIVRDASLGLEVSDESKIAPVLASAHTTAAMFGGYVSNETSTSIIFKVPTDKLDAALTRAVPKNVTVTRHDITARDVTASYVDLSIRIDNARRLQVRLREIEGQTQDVARLLEIERELARVTEELESLEGQMRVMENETTYASVSLDVSTAIKPGPIGYVFYGLYTGVKWLFVRS